MENPLEKHPIIKELFYNKCSLCGEPYFLNGGFNAHHITPISEGGKDILNNILLLCPTCHGKVHGGMISKEKQYQINKQILYKQTKEKL